MHIKLDKKMAMDISYSSFLAWTLILFEYLCKLSCIQATGAENFTSTNSYRLPVVYVYTVVPRVCKHGLPLYIKTSLEQAIFSQPDCDVILASNFADCATVGDSVKDLKKLIKIDTTVIASNRTLTFLNASTEMFQSDNHGELWITSALRFFIMEDIMVMKGYFEMMHVEADNLLYGKLTDILSVLRTGYPTLAATPLNANKSFITASVLWIASFAAIYKFNNYLLGMGLNINNGWKKYLKWLRTYACCKRGGPDSDAEGNGLKPFAINEMSMLAFYHEIEPNELKLLPVVPAHNYILNKYVCNMSMFGPGGPEVGPATGHGIWDSNSWGQHIGGTHSRKGKDVGFTDASHISGQAIRMSSCKISMECGNQTDSNNRNTTSASSSSFGCHTAPFVRCGEDQHWTPLWNLHVHSKHTEKFRSLPCTCQQ